MRMFDPAHPGEIIRDCMEAEDWSVTACALRLGVTRNTLSRLLNGKAGSHQLWRWHWSVYGWSSADHWMRMQASYDLAQEHRKQTVAA